MEEEEEEEALVEAGMVLHNTEDVGIIERIIRKRTVALNQFKIPHLIEEPTLGSVISVPLYKHSQGLIEM